MNESKSILIVDDDIATLSIIKKFLKIIKYNNVTCESDVVQAIKICKTKQFDILILDIIMPRIDGFSFLEQLEFKPIVIGITGYPNFNDKQLKVFDYFLSKPFTRLQFEDLIKQIENDYR